MPSSKKQDGNNDHLQQQYRTLRDLFLPPHFYPHLPACTQQTYFEPENQKSLSIQVVALIQGVDHCNFTSSSQESNLIYILSTGQKSFPSGPSNAPNALQLAVSLAHDLRRNGLQTTYWFPAQRHQQSKAISFCCCCFVFFKANQMYTYLYLENVNLTLVSQMLLEHSLLVNPQ